MATGDITATIRPDGWTASLSVEGFTSGATYAFGYTGSNIPGASTPFFTVVSQGYDVAGTLGTITRTVYFTTNVDVPYSTATINGSFTSGTFTDGETVTQATSGATAKIVGNQSSGTKLRFRTITGTFNNVNIITGGTSGATFVSSSTITTLTLPVHDELVTSTGIITRVALSDYIYLDDNTGAGKSGTAPTVTIPAAFVTNTGGASQTSNALSAAAVTQNSLQDYANAIARFVTLPYKLLNGAFTVECQAFNRHAINGNPVAAVKFTLADGTVTRTQTVTGMSLSSDDGLPVYACADNASNFTQGANVTCRIECFPWVGDADNVQDSSANAWQNTGMNLANLPVGVCDKTLAYGVTFCAVSSSGSDSNTTAYTSQAAAEAGLKTLTPGKAISNIQAFNNANYSRNTPDAGVVILIGGGHKFGLGLSSSAANVACAVTITRSTTDTRSSAYFDGRNTDSSYFAGATRIYDCSFIAGASQLLGFVHNTAPIIFEDCTFTGIGAGTRPISSDTDGKAAAMWKNVTMTAFNNGMSSGNDCCGLLARGCSISDATSGAFSGVRAVTGCDLIDTASVANFYLISTTAWTDLGNIVLSFNEAFSHRDSFLANGTAIPINDLAIVGNIDERVGASASPSIEMSSAAIKNVIVWHNTIAGQRVNTEGDVTGAPGSGTDRVYQLCSFKFNSWYYNGTHNPGDVHVQNGAITGQWPYSQFCVGWGGNNSEMTPDLLTNYSFGGIGTTITTSADYVSDRSVQGTDAGGGDYHPDTGSILRGKVPSGLAVIPFDYSGSPISNSGLGSAGALQPLFSGIVFFFQSDLMHGGMQSLSGGMQ